MQVIQDLLKEINKAAEEHKGTLDKAFWKLPRILSGKATYVDPHPFGSYKQGTYTTHSDLDVIIKNNTQDR
jgi:DNA polymerase sigma